MSRFTIKGFAYPEGSPMERLQNLENMIEDRELVERKRGEWVSQADGTHYCSVCGHDATFSYEKLEICGVACPFCGADMRGDKE